MTASEELFDHLEKYIDLRFMKQLSEWTGVIEERDNRENYEHAIHIAKGNVIVWLEDFKAEIKRELQEED